MLFQVVSCYINKVPPTTVLQQLARRAPTHNYNRTHAHCLAIHAKQNKSTVCKQFDRLINTGLASALATSANAASAQATRPHVDPKLSYSFGRSSENLIYSTVAQEFERHVKEAPDEIAYIGHDEDKIISYRQLEHDVHMLAKGLSTKLGVKKNDFVCVYAYNCYNWALVQFACSRIGAVLVPINPSYKSDELAFVLKWSKVKCLFMPGPKSVQARLNDHLSILQSELIVDMSKSRELMLENVVFMDAEHDYDIKNMGLKLSSCRFNNWSYLENDAHVFSSIDDATKAGVKPEHALILGTNLLSPDDLFAVYYTSGTTGRPKGACVSQFTAINNVRFCQQRLRSGRSSGWKVNVATVLPMFHIFAGVLNTLSPIISKTTLICASHMYDIKVLVEAIIKHSANITTLTPTILIDLLTYIEQANIAPEVPLKIIQPGGAFMPPELVTRAFKLLPNLEDVRQGYGSTENGAVASFQSIYEPIETRAHSVGYPMDFCEIRVTDLDGSNKVVPHGVQGEIQTRGYNTMVEYLDEPAKTKEVLTENKWYRTGDIGFMYPHGSICISGRLKHMIIKGGENIYPDEVEQMMYKMECIEKVHVVGIPDERFGEQVCAWVKLKPGYTEFELEPSSKRGDKEVHKNDIISFCKEQMTYFKVPKYLFFVDDFPMTPTKKVQKHIMAEQTIEWLGQKK